MNSGESTSITYEKAEQLMGAVIYCIREWEREQADLPGEKEFGAWNWQVEEEHSLEELQQQEKKVSAVNVDQEKKVSLMLKTSQASAPPALLEGEPYCKSAPRLF